MKEEFNYWEAVVNTMTDGLMVVDLDRVIVSINKAMEEMMGRRKEQLIGKPCSVIECDTCFNIRGSQNLIRCNLFKSGKITKRRCTFGVKNGRRIHALKNATIFRDQEGKVIGGVETFTDLSEIMKRDQKIRRLHQVLSHGDGFHGIQGKSPTMVRVFDHIQNAAQSEAPVIIYGESGTGKEMVANVIHQLGRRKKGPYVRVNCSALSESLLESELFGYEKGAFTGAYETRKGRFEAADGGDIFLDEIGDVPLSTQVKLLRVLQEKEIERVGDYHSIKCDVRVISATHWNLKERAKEGRFREDLFYRLHVIPIYLPPLRERMEDIPILVNSSINELRLRTEKPIQGISTEVMALFTQYSWPGNIRELMNTLEYAFVACHGEFISLEHLPEFILETKRKGSRSGKQTHKAMEKESLIWALKQAAGKKVEAARMLGVSRQTFWKRIKKYKVQVQKNIIEE